MLRKTTTTKRRHKRMSYINPDYYLYEKIRELQTKVIRLTDELADANYTIKKLQQKENFKCQN